MRSAESVSASQILVWIIAGYASVIAGLSWVLSDWVAANAGLSLAAALLVWMAAFFRKERTPAVVVAVLLGLVIAWPLGLLLAAVEGLEWYQRRTNIEVEK
jgi:hypothetical protein